MPICVNFCGLSLRGGSYAARGFLLIPAIVKSSFSLCALAAAVLLPGCATFHPSTETSRHVIASLTADDRHPSPWRLGLAWFPGAQGGAALRSAGVEHVLRQKDPILFHVVPSQNPDLSPATRPTAQDDETDRAWRKFCRHQLDMTERERQIIRDTPIPDWLVGHCYSGSLLK